MRYQYLLIDNDNTIMDFSAAEAKALVDLFASYDIPTDEDTIRRYLGKALHPGQAEGGALCPVPGGHESHRRPP